MTPPQNRYEMLGTLGVGATSRVDKARDTLIGRTVALKTFLQGFGSRDLQAQFHREAQIIGRLAHPCIISLYDVGTNTDGLPYFVMEYVDGKTLEDVLAAGPLPLARAAIWAADLAEALSRAHKAKIIHGDVKPANILVTPEGRVKLGDFGVARFATQISGTGSVLGTPAYLSPEQINGHMQDARSDLFSLGIVLYHMLSGVRPFQGTSVGAVCAQILSSTPPPPSHYNPAVPAALDRVVMRCLAKDPVERYATAESLAASLYPFARNVAPPEEHRMSWWKRPFQPRDAIYMGAAGMLVLFALLVARSWPGKRFDNGRVLAATTSTRGSEPLNMQVANVAGEPESVSAAPAEFVNFAEPVKVEPVASDPAKTPAGPARKRAVRSSPEKRPGFSANAGSHPSTTDGQAANPAQLAAPEVVHTLPAMSALAATPARAMMRVNVTSGVADEILAIYAGQDLLLSTPLDEAHLHETLHFDCPITSGPHALRVALYHADQSLHVQKEGLTELTPGGSGVMEIRVNRRTKMLVKHDTSLEVLWPGMTAPTMVSLPSVTSPRSSNR